MKRLFGTTGYIVTEITPLPACLSFLNIHFVFFSTCVFALVRLSLGYIHNTHTHIRIHTLTALFPPLSEELLQAVITQNKPEMTTCHNMSTHCVCLEVLMRRETQVELTEEQEADFNIISLLHVLEIKPEEGFIQQTFIPEKHRFIPVILSLDLNDVISAFYINTVLVTAKHDES